MKKPESKHMRFSSLRSWRGFSLIELMVAMFLGIIVSAGIITLFSSTSRANRVQQKLASIQENARFAVSRLTDDLHMVNSEFCSNTGGPAHLSSTGFVYLDNLRSPQIVTKNLVLSDGTVPSFASSVSSPYSLPARVYLGGSECDNSSCTPSVPAVLPAMGTSAGSRVKGADVLTVRRLSGQGWKIEPTPATSSPATQLTCNGSNNLTSITLTPATGEAPASRFASGDLAMLADCSSSQVFSVNASMQPDSNNMSGTDLKCVFAKNDGRLFDFSKDFTTVTYFLQLAADDNPDAPAGHLVANLMRRVNSSAAQVMVRGVERFDVSYGVEDDLGRTIFLTADDVDDRAGGTIDCPPGPPNPPAGVDVGCLWRSVKSLNVNLLVNGVDTMFNMPDAELQYTYAPDGSGLQTPAATPTNGLDRRMMRRGFNFVVSIRNYNP
ncbi:MAG: PilW family protein [Rhodanobacteraceae bacterium]